MSAISRAVSSPPKTIAAKSPGVGTLLAAPAAIALLVLFVGPTIAVGIIALTDWQLGLDSFSFIGAHNFEVLLRDRHFLSALTNTGIYALIVVPTTIVLGLGVALLIESGRSFRAFYRAAHFLPVMATMAAMAIAWEALLHPTVGLIMQVVTALGFERDNWLANEGTSLITLAAIGVWQNFGYAMVLFLAGLKVIPQDLYDAAAIDGADGPFDRLRTVTLPMLGPTLMFVSIVLGLRAIQVFDTVNILTQGGPGQSSTVLMYQLYIESFVYLRTGYGAAIAVVLLLIVLFLTLVQARVMDRRVHYS